MTKRTHPVKVSATKANLVSNSSVHRHADTVAFSFDGTDTLYLTHEEARAFAAKLLTVADDIEQCDFVDSLIGSL